MSPAQSSENRHPHRWLNAFFVGITLLFLGVVIARTLSLQHSLHIQFHHQAEMTATRTAHHVATQLHQHFASLAFLNRLALTEKASAWKSQAQISDLCQTFAQTHPALAAIRIEDALHHTRCQVIVPAKGFHALPDQQHAVPISGSRFLNGVRWYPQPKAYLTTIGLSVQGTSGQPLGTITGAFWVTIPRVPGDLYALHMIPSGKAAASAPPPAFFNNVIRPILGYPLMIRATWTIHTLQQAFWKRLRPRLWIVSGFLAFILLSWIISRKLLGDFLRQSHYQAMALRVQQTLIRQDKLADMYLSVLDALVTQTPATGAAILIPESRHDSLKVIAIRAQTPALKNAITARLNGQDRDRLPDDCRIALDAFHQKCPQGPTRCTQSTDRVTEPPLQALSPRLQSVTAYPVRLDEDQDPVAIMVIYHKSHHFTRSLRQLVTQLSNMLGVGWMRWQDRQSLLDRHLQLSQLSEKISHQNELLAAFIEAIPDAVFFKDGHGAWQIVNEAAIRLFQLQDIAWQGKTDLELADLHPAFRAIHEDCVADDEKAWRSQKLVVVEEYMPRADGGIATFETRKVPIFTPKGDRLGLVVLGRDISERKAAEAQLQHLALYDSLTNLPNRRSLEMQLEQAVLRAQRHRHLLAVCILDLDNFKPVNDTHGHEAGDSVLVALGQRLTDSLRKIDFVARFGGDEFVILLEELSQSTDIYPLLNKIDAVTKTPIALNNHQQVQVGASIGVALYRGKNHTKTARQLLREADQALYENKSHKKDRQHAWTIFGEKAPASRTPAQKLLDAGHLEVWYQPILDNFTRNIVGIEALARLRDAEGHLWSPARFLPQLEDADFTHLTKSVLSQALTDLAFLDQQGHHLWVSVNLDAHSVSAECVECLRGILALNPIDPERITLEILEGDDFLDKQTSIEYLQAIKALGIQLALDDLGSAYASLMRMKMLPIDKIKLDQAFVRTLEDQPRDMCFVDTIQALATSLGVTLVVEGVETADILDAMAITGVSLLQGYAIAKPLPLQKLQAFLQCPPLTPPAYPQSFLGLYALHLALHSVMEKTMRQNLRLMDYKEMVDPTICPLHQAMQYLEVLPGSPLELCHHAYHASIAECISRASTSPNTLHWEIVERAQRDLERAILDAYETSRRR